MKQKEEYFLLQKESEEEKKERKERSRQEVMNINYPMTPPHYTVTLTHPWGGPTFL